MEEALQFVPNKEWQHGKQILYTMTQERLDEFVEAYKMNPFFTVLKSHGELASDTSLAATRYVLSPDGLLWFRDADHVLHLCIPRGQLRDVLLRDTHESPFKTAHAGGQKLLQQLRLKYWWPGMEPRYSNSHRPVTSARRPSRTNEGRSAC